jgi:hypothetical protein
MKREYEDLKKIYQSSLEQSRTADKECPDTDMIIQSFSSTLSESEKYRVVDHISECPLCNQKFAIVRQVFSKCKKMVAGFEGMSLTEEETRELKEIAKAKIKELESPEHSDSRTAFKPGSLFLLWQKTAFKYATAFAGLVVIAVIAFFILRAPHIGLEDTVRGIQADVIQLTKPKGELAKTPRSFEWNPVEGAAAYQVVLLDEELVEVWVSEKNQQTSLTLPQFQFEAIERGKIYYWKVIVFSSDRSTKESGLQEFEVERD